MPIHQHGSVVLRSKRELAPHPLINYSTLRDKSNNLTNRPHMLTNPRFHRRGDAQRLVNPRKVVVNMKQRQRVNMILNLLAETIRQACEAAVLHSQVEILALHKRSADMFRIGRTKYAFFFDAKTLRGAVRPSAFRISPENLNELRLVVVI